MLIETVTPEPQLELGMQELETLEAPDFWDGFKTGVTIGTAIIASAAIAT